MKKSLFRTFYVFNVILLLSLVACSNPADDDNLLPIQPVQTGYAFPDATGIAKTFESVVYIPNAQKSTIETTYLSGWEDIPFLSMENASKLISLLNGHGWRYSSDNPSLLKYNYYFEDSQKHPPEWDGDTLYFDLENQMIYSDEFTRIMSASGNINNGIGGDCVGSIPEASSGSPIINFSSKTSQIQPKQRTVIRLSDYGLKMFAIEGKLYIPFSVIASTFSLNQVLSFNGKDYFLGINPEINPSDSFWNEYKTGYKNTGIRSRLMAEYSYQNLCLLFDFNYSLKNQRATNILHKDNITSFNTSIRQAGLYDSLVSTSTQIYNDALVKFLLGYVDDGHTSYCAPSLWMNEPNDDEIKTAARINTGSRGTALRNSIARLNEARNKACGDNGFSYGSFYYIGNPPEMAVITFDDFNDDNPANESDLSKLVNLNTYAFLKHTFAAIEELDKEKTIKNIVIDLSNNEGGSIRQCLLALSFLADPSEFYLPIRNHLDGSITKFYYEVGEKLKKNYHFYVLTSSFSFSCGNFFPSICKYQLNIPVIGQTSGGGGGTVKNTQSSDGALFRTSAALEMCALVNGNYQSIDGGVPVDLEIPEKDFYAGEENIPYIALYNILREKYPENF